MSTSSPARFGKIAAAAFVAAIMGLGGTAMAQSQNPGTQVPAAQSTPQFTGEQISSFATAMTNISQISERYQPRIDGAGSPDEAKALQQEAQAQMIKTIEEQGISVDEYNQIAAAARIDRDVYDRIMRELN